MHFNGVHRAYGQSFHTSIWHVSLAGIIDEIYVDKIRKDFDEVGPNLHQLILSVR